MSIEDIDKKIKAIQIAENCIHTINLTKPDAVDLSIFATLADIKMDLIDAKDNAEEDLLGLLNSLSERI